MLIVEADHEATKGISKRHFYTHGDVKAMTELYEVAPPVMNLVAQASSIRWVCMNNKIN